jgi:hypothetical protein
MKIAPKYPNAEHREFKLSYKSRKILEHFSDYTGLTESQVLEEILPHLLNDKDFIKFIDSKRSNVRIKRELGIDNE